MRLHLLAPAHDCCGSSTLGAASFFKNVVKLNGKQGTRQNLAAILGSRAGSIRCRRPKANKEEEVGAQQA